MNTRKRTEVIRRRTLVALAVAVTLVVAYTVVPIRPEGTSAVQPEADQEPAVQRVSLASRKSGPAGALAERQAAELQRQLDLLQAKPGDHGLVLTLGDVVFTSGRSDFKTTALSSLNRLVNFLDKYRDRRVAIHGYTDSLGGEEYNQGLSERRANAVKAYLTAQGIDATRLSASGMGQTDPVAGNDSGAGRQQNRRVEVIIGNPPAQSKQRPPTARMIMLLALFGSISGQSGRPFF